MNTKENSKYPLEEYIDQNEKTDNYFEESFNIYEYFEIYNQIYFENLLGSITLSWSSRMTSCAGVFSVYKGIPTIRLSECLLKYRNLNEVRETLLHEMIHAYCYIKKYDMSDDLSGHGKYFKNKMIEINNETGLNITIYHNFINEVNYYTKYIWRCNGICRFKKPYFGFVKRQINRPPQKADKWFEKHKKECGGTFIRISPSEDDEKKIKKKKNKERKLEEKKNKNSVKNNSNNIDFYLTNFSNKKDCFSNKDNNNGNNKHLKKRKEGFSGNIYTLSDYK